MTVTTMAMNDDDWSEDYYPQDENDHNHLIAELLRRNESQDNDGCETDTESGT